MAATETVRAPGAACRTRRRGGDEEALDARPLPAALDRARDGGGLGARLADPEPERRPRPAARRHRLAADRARAAADDVPGAGEGALRGARPHASTTASPTGSSSASRSSSRGSSGRCFMFALAWLFLADQPEYRTGVIIVGLARCIAMVLIWNDLAKGDRDRAAMLVVFNAIFQVAAFSLLGYFYLTVLPGWLGLDTQGLRGRHLGGRAHRADLPRHPARRRVPHPPHRAEAQGPRLVRAREFIPRISPITLYGLLFTIVLLFAIQGDTITVAAARRRPDRAAAARLLRRHVGRRVRDRQADPACPTRRPPASASRSPRNDFELAIAVAVGVFGATSGRGARRRRRTADRGTRARRARLRRALGTPVLARRRRARRPGRTRGGLTARRAAGAPSRSNPVRRVGELAEVTGHQVRDLLADVDGVIADPFDAARDDQHAQTILAFVQGVTER